MPRNIELKARISSLSAAQAIAQRLATQRLGTLHQIDTYFQAARGRLKLREIERDSSVLIAYHRPDEAQARGSDYVLVPVTEPDLFKQALATVLGVRAVVDKVREVFLYHNVRIHLDQVRSLGEFLEFESVLGGEIDDLTGRQQLQWLCTQFGITGSDIEPRSYGDMVAAIGQVRDD